MVVLIAEEPAFFYLTIPAVFYLPSLYGRSSVGNRAPRVSALFPEKSDNALPSYSEIGGLV